MDARLLACGMSTPRNSIFHSQKGSEHAGRGSDEDFQANQVVLFQVQVWKPQSPNCSGLRVYSRLGEKIRFEDQQETFHSLCESVWVCPLSMSKEKMSLLSVKMHVSFQTSAHNKSHVKTLFHTVGTDVCMSECGHTSGVGREFGLVARSICLNRFNRSNRPYNSTLKGNAAQFLSV